jgi:hypothetical protein
MAPKDPETLRCASDGMKEKGQKCEKDKQTREENEVIKA